MGAAGVAVGLMGAGSLLGAYGQYQQGQAQAAQDRQNATFANMAASDALQRGGQQAGLLRMRGSQLIAQQKVGYAASGVDTSSGTPLSTMADTRMMSELDAQQAKNNAAREAWGYRVQGAQYRAQADLDEQRGTYGAIGTMLGGIGQVAGFAGGGGGALRTDPTRYARNGTRIVNPMGGLGG